MDNLPNHGRRGYSETTRLCFSPKYNRVELILDPEWSSVLCPNMNDRLEIGLSDQRSGPLLVFIDRQWHGHHGWERHGKRGALMISFKCKAAFDWCRDLLPGTFEYVPTEIEPFREQPGIRGIKLDWPGWSEVLTSHLTTQENEDLFRRRLERMQLPPELFVEAFIDGERVLF